MKNFLFYLQTFAFVVLSLESFNVVIFFCVFRVSPNTTGPRFLECASQWNYEFVIFFIRNTQNFPVSLCYFIFSYLTMFHKTTEWMSTIVKREFRARRKFRIFSTLHTRVVSALTPQDILEYKRELQNLKHNTLVTKYPYYFAFFCSSHWLPQNSLEMLKFDKISLQSPGFT